MYMYSSHCTHLNVNTHTLIYVCIYVFIYTYMYIFICIHIYTYTNNVYIHTRYVLHYTAPRPLPFKLSFSPLTPCLSLSHVLGGWATQIHFALTSRVQTRTTNWASAQQTCTLLYFTSSSSCCSSEFQNRVLG